MSNILAKRIIRFRSSNSLLTDIRNIFHSSKKIKQNNEENINNIKKKKANEVSKIFAKYRQLINKIDENNKDNNIEFSDEIPFFIKRYINSNLSQQ